MCDASDLTVGAVLGQRINGKFKPIYYASKTLNNAQEHYTTTEKELLAVVFSFDKFHPYLILSKTIIKDKKWAENLVADHLSRLENPNLGIFTEDEIADKFLDEHLMILKTELNKDEPWYANYDEPYAFKLCPDNIMRRCVARDEICEIMTHCHSGPTRGHHSASITGRKVYEAGFFWPRIFKDAKDCGLDFMGPFPNSKGNKYILVAVDYVSKWVKDQALPTNDARIVIKFLRRLFARFKVPKALISDRAVAKNRFMELNELMELRDGAYENTQIYKERTKKWHDFRLHGDKNFKVGDKFMTRSSTKELFTPFKDPEQEFRSSMKHFKTLSLDESRSPDFDLFFDQEEYSEEEVAKTMAETMEQYMSKTRADYGSGISRPKIEDKDNFELKGQFLKELRTNTFSGSDHEDVNEHIEKVLKIVDLFQIPNITIDQVTLRAFPMSLTGAASHLARTIPSEVVLFYNGLDVPTRQILDSRGVIPSQTTADAKIIRRFFGDYIELNDLNVPLDLRRDQVDDLMPTIEEGKVVEEFRARNDARMVSKVFGYLSNCNHDKKIRIDCAYNLKFSCMIDFAVLEDMDAYRDEGMGDVIFGEPFLREVRINAKRFEGMITIHNGNEEVTYQMVRSHPRFKHHTNEQCNKIPPLLKVSEEDKMNGISHSYQKLKSFYKGVLNLGPEYVRDAEMEEWLTRGHISVHEME
ncbi:homeodomain-like protein [Tanacetum coccineum]